MVQGPMIFDFNDESSLDNWLVVDDVVMGGRSDGNLVINDEGHGEFRGDVSLENNGGFSSIRYRPSSMDVSDYSSILLKVKGDGKSYQLRIKSSRFERHSYTYTFNTSGDWEEIVIPMNEMTPTFRGMKLRISNYPGEKLEEIGFLISNKKNESFKLIIDSIKLEKGYKNVKYVWNKEKPGEKTS